jgi:hypothetical protein
LPTSEEEKSERKPKPFFDEQVKCVHCGKPNHVKAFRKVVTPSRPAQVEIEVIVEGGDSTLEEFDKE